MSEFPLWSELIRQALPSQDAPKTGEKLSVKESREVAPSLKKGMYAVVAIENNKVLPYSMAWDFNATEIVLYANMLRTKHPQATISIEAKGGRISQVLKPGELFKEAHAVELKPGTRVKTPHGRGKIVRYDKGDGPHGSPYYIVDVGKQASEKVMAHQLQREETMIGPGSRVKTPYGIGQVVRYDKVEKLYIVDVGKNAFNKVTPPTWIVGQAKKVKPNQIQREPVPRGWTVRREAAEPQPEFSSGNQKASGWPPGLKIAAIKSYREKEKNNDHTGNALFVTRMFGKPQEIAIVQKLWDIRAKEGIDANKHQSLMSAVEMLHSKYYRQLMSLKEDKKPYVWECMDCGNIWRSTQSGNTRNVSCPKCHSDDVLPGKFISDRAGYTAKNEDSDSDYQEYFKKMLQKHNYDSPADIPDDKKDDFFNAVDTGYSAKNEDSDSDYQEYFKKMLQKHGYDSPADIPDDKKDDFFNAVDTGYSAKNEEVDPTASDEHESDDQDMMSAQVDSLADKSAELHDILNQLKLADVPAWIQSKVSTADTDINSILDYMKYEEKHPVAEDVSDNQGMDRARSMARGAAAAPFQQRLPTMKEPVVPMRMQAAMVVAKALGSVRGTGQSADFKVSSSSPEALVNQALRVWLSGSHTNEGWALGAKMLKLAKEMGIKWDEKLVRSKLAPITLKKLGLDEAESAPVVGVSNAEKLAQRQGAEKETLALRHNKEKTSQAQRDGEEKIRKQAAASTQTKTSK